MKHQVNVGAMLRFSCRLRCVAEIRRGLSTVTESVCAPQIQPPSKTPLPLFRVLSDSRDGKLVPKGFRYEKDNAKQLFSEMLRLQTLDEILLSAQRQGIISFYMTSQNEEAAVIGTAASLSPKDTIFAQYREMGMLLYRGATYEDIINQCLGNVKGHGRGRQMPMHFGSREHNFQTISSPVATQIPQAVGASYAMKGADSVSVVMFGDGAASEGDFAAGLQFAAVLKTPTLFVCRNNGWAISTHASQQYAGACIASRGSGYGVAALRVDGDDLFAVMEGVRAAREYALEDGGRPVLVEIVTYRGGDHSTSDDSRMYRDSSGNEAGCMAKMREYLVQMGWWREEEELSFVEDARKDIINCLKVSERLPKAEWEDMFTDIYAEKPESLLKQEESLRKPL